MPDTIESFAEYHTHAYRYVIPIGIAIGIAGVIGFLILDRVVYPDHVVGLFWIRVFSVALALFAIPISKTKLVSRYPWILLYVIMLGLSIPVVLMTVVTEGFASWYVLGAILVINSGMSIVPYYPRHHFYIAVITFACISRLM